MAPRSHRGAIQRIKDRARSLDHHYACSRQDCGLYHVRRWLNLHQPLNQSETLKISQKIKGVIKVD